MKNYGVLVNEIKISMSDLVPVCLGSLYLALLAQAQIPMTPIPMTLQTFAILTMGLFMGSRRATLAVLLYLLEATCGLPVFPGLCSAPLWMLDPSAGYCFSFPLAAFLTGKIAESSPSILRLSIGVVCGQLVIYGIGVAWLSLYVGAHQAWLAGVIPFLFFDLVKMAGAVAARKAYLQFPCSPLAE